MFRLILASVLVAYVAAQSYHGDPRTAAIISEQRYLSGDGKFGAAYTQEDGTNFKEETDADGTRRGSYSYVDPSGQKRTISYTAGKNGFVASGNDIPVAPAPPPHAAPVPAYQPNPQYNPAPAQAAPAPRSYLSNDDFINSGQYDERFNDPNFQPNIRPAAPKPSFNQHYTAPQQSYQPAPQQQQHYTAPQTYNPAPQQQQHYQPPPPQYTTEQPHRFQPPGKLSLNRTPDGFSYNFNKA